MLNQEELQKIRLICERENIKKISLFGSYARNMERQDSDVDLIIESDQALSLFDLVGLEQNFSQELNKKIDLLTRNSINKHLRSNISQEEILIYEK